MNTLDFTKGIDFTGINPATGADHNTLIESATPKNESGDETIGHGIVLCTEDTALDTADIPDADVTTKWKRYLWLRRPHPTATVQASTVYAWLDDAPYGALYHWVPLSADLSTIEAAIAALESDVTTALSTANSAATTANNANTVANTANNTAISASATAGSAASVAASAQADATTAIGNAASAYSLADEANTQADAAAAAAASAAVNANKVADNKFYESAEATIVAGPIIGPVAHGLGVVPKFSNLFLICRTTAEAGYVDGDHICNRGFDGDTQKDAFGIVLDATNVTVLGLSTNPGDLRIIHKTTGAYTSLTAAARANWKIKIVLWT